MTGVTSVFQPGDEAATVGDISKSETDISHETSGQFQAMFVAAAVKTFDKPSGHFQKVLR